MALAIGLTQRYVLVQAVLVLGISVVYTLYLYSWNHFNFYIKWPFEVLVNCSAPLMHVYLVDVWMQAASCTCAASMLVLLPLIGYDLGDPKTVSAVVGYLLQVTIACRIIFCFLKIGIGFCHSCYVKTVTKKWSQTFDAVDANQDGRIDRQEWISHFGDSKGFDAYDISHDGCVSHAEFLAHEKALRQNAPKLDAEDKLLIHRKNEFGSANVDNDGRIDRQEWIAHFGDDTEFDLCDINHDGSISRAEFVAFKEFSALDLDDDDGINREEWVAHFGDDDGFDAHDVDNDGLVSRIELLAMLATRLTDTKGRHRKKQH